MQFQKDCSNGALLTVVSASPNLKMSFTATESPHYWQAWSSGRVEHIQLNFLAPGLEL